MALIQVENLEKAYPDGTQALRGVSFAIESGEYTALMGPSGSGKSTLLHVLGFLDTQTSGTYHFKGKTKDDYGEHNLAHVRNREIGFVFQQFNLLPRLSVEENVVVPLYYSTVPSREWRERAQKAIAAVGLEHRISHSAYMLSGGEKQRVAIARALINQPEVIFADEPTGNLDTSSGDQVIAILEELHKKGHTVILITHDPEVADRAHGMLYIRDGKLENDTRV